MLPLPMMPLVSHMETTDPAVGLLVNFVNISSFCGGLFLISTTCLLSMIFKLTSESHTCFIVDGWRPLTLSYILTELRLVSVPS